MLYVCSSELVLKKRMVMKNYIKPLRLKLAGNEFAPPLRPLFLCQGGIFKEVRHGW